MPVIATAVPWIFAAAAWAYLRHDIPSPADAGRFLGTEAAFRAGVALTGFWVLSGLALMGCSFYVISHRTSALAWSCAAVNALGLVLPMLVFAWVNWGTL